VVTGAARGIGLAVARRLAAEGYRVAALDIDAPALFATAAGLLRPECDVADPGQVGRCIEKVEREFGRLDALVNNAGIAVFKPLLETSYEEWSRVLAVNLNGPFLLTQACAPIMLRSGGGAVVNIASISGMRA